MNRLWQAIGRQRERELFQNPFTRTSAERDFWRFMCLVTNFGWVVLFVSIVAQVAFGSSK